MPDIDNYAFANQVGILFGSMATIAGIPTAAERDAIEAASAELLDGRLLKLDPIQALGGFLMGLGTPQPQVNVTPLPLNPAPRNSRSYEAIVAAIKSQAETQRAVKNLTKILEDETGRRYQHSVLPRMVADMLGDIFGSRRDPGEVLDEAIESRFNVTGGGYKLKELWRIASDARNRVVDSPQLLTDLVLPWIAKAIAGDGGASSRPVLELSACLVRLLFLDDPQDEDAARIEVGMYLGGLLGAICLCPFQDRFDTDSTVDTWDADAIRRARDWAMLMAQPNSGATLLERWSDVQKLEPLRQIGWLPSTDFLLRLNVLGSGNWFNEYDGDETGLQDFLYERIREGAMLAAWRSGGRYEVAPDEAIAPLMVRDHNFGRMQDRSTRWDLTVSLNALTDEGFAAWGSDIEAIPHHELIEDAIEDALESQQWELAEALASIWLLHRLVLGSNESYKADVPEDFLAWQRRMQPREYGYLGPTVRYLLVLSQTEEYASQGWTQALKAISEVFTKGEPENQELEAVTESAVRSELVGRLIGPVFMQLPVSVKSKLVDVVSRRKLLAKHVDDGKVRHFGGDTVALVNPLESMLRERFCTLSEESFRVLDALGFRFQGAQRSNMTLGPMIMVLKKYPGFPAGLQQELGAIFPCLPLSRDVRENLFSLLGFRNDGAHEDVDLAQYDVAWSLLFSQSYKDAVDNPRIYAILGRQHLTDEN